MHWLESQAAYLGWPVIGESFAFISEFSSHRVIHNFIKTSQQRYGKVFKTSILGRYAVFMTGREAGRQDFANRERWDVYLEPLLHWTTNAWPNHQLAPTVWRTAQATQKVMGNMMMSLEPTGTHQEKFRANFKVISSCFASLPINLRGTAFHRGMQARERMFSMFDSIIPIQL